MPQNDRFNLFRIKKTDFTKWRHFPQPNPDIRNKNQKTKKDDLPAVSHPYKCYSCASFLYMIHRLPPLSESRNAALGAHRPDRQGCGHVRTAYGITQTLSLDEECSERPVERITGTGGIDGRGPKSGHAHFLLPVVVQAARTAHRDDELVGVLTDGAFHVITEECAALQLIRRDERTFFEISDFHRQERRRIVDDFYTVPMTEIDDVFDRLNRDFILQHDVLRAFQQIMRFLHHFRRQQSIRARHDDDRVVVVINIDVRRSGRLTCKRFHIFTKNIVVLQIVPQSVTEAVISDGTDKRRLCFKPGCRNRLVCALAAVCCAETFPENRLPFVGHPFSLHDEIGRQTAYYYDIHIFHSFYVLCLLISFTSMTRLSTASPAFSAISMSNALLPRS